MRIFIKAKPNSKNESINKLSDSNFEVCVKEPPINGRANAAIVVALAKHFGVSVARIRLISGRISRQKIFEIDVVNS